MSDLPPFPEEFDPDWVLKWYANQPFEQEVFDERISDPDAFLERFYTALEEMMKFDLEWLPSAPTPEAHAFQIKFVSAILNEMFMMMVIARSSFAAAVTDDPRYAMVVAKLFFRLGYLCSNLETFAVEFHGKGRSQTLFRLAGLGERGLQQRREAGKARAKADRIQRAGSRQTALDLAISIRDRSPNSSQEDLARAVKDRLGSLVPKESALVKWIQAWERAGDLRKPPRRS